MDSYEELESSSLVEEQSQLQIFPLQACEHVFHKECLSEYFWSQVQETKFPLKCPDVKCGVKCCENDIGQILKKEQFLKYQERTLNLAIDIE